MDEKKRRLGFAILEFLTSTKEGLTDDEKKESIDGSFLGPSKNTCPSFKTKSPLDVFF